MFRDRQEAGSKLAAALVEYKGQEPLVVALPRGGLPVAVEVAAALEVPLGILLVRKLGAPGHQELAIGAVVACNRKPQVVLDQELIARLHVTDRYIRSEIVTEMAEIRRRERQWDSSHNNLEPKDRKVIIVDDGVATGSTALAAIKGLKTAGAGQVILAIPVAPSQTVEKLAQIADRVVCLDSPPFFQAVGAFYQDFKQVTDQEVQEILRRAAIGPQGIGGKTQMR